MNRYEKKSSGRKIGKRGLCIASAVLLGSMLCVSAAAMEDTDAAASAAASVQRDQQGNTERAAGVALNEQNFPDEMFRQYVASSFDTNSDNVLSAEEINAVERIDLDAYSLPGTVKSAKGIEYFTELKSFRNWENGLEELDLSQNTKLERVLCHMAKLTTLDVQNNTNLVMLRVNYTPTLTELNMGNLPLLEELDFSATQILSLDVSHSPRLKILSCNLTPISKLDLSNNTELLDLSLGESGISELDVSHNTKLERLIVSETEISKLDLSQNTNLKELFCRNMKLEQLDVTKNPKLETLSASETPLGMLDLTNNHALTSLSHSAKALKMTGEYNLTNVDSYVPRYVLDSYEVSGHSFEPAKAIPGLEAERLTDVSVTEGAVWNAEKAMVEHIDGGTVMKYRYRTDGVNAQTKEPLYCAVKFRVHADWMENGWVVEDGVEYWYEDDVKQGTEGRGKEIYDPESDAWYWLDAVQGGAKTVNKDVYQESEAGQWADRPDGTGKWVRYDANGHMVKGWSTNENGTYYFDPVYGTMAKGEASIDGKACYFDPATGVGADQEWVNLSGNEYWYEDAVRQGYDPNDAGYRGKEIYDPASDAWYWLDAVQGGAKTVNKDVYQESEAGQWADRPDGTGKWVRYDANGHMVKGWQTTSAGTYYFDPVFGTMAKGDAVIDGQAHYFDKATGVMVR